MGKARVVAFVIAVAPCTCCLGLAACAGQAKLESVPESQSGDVVASDEAFLPPTPAYYVFESITIDGNTIIDPKQLVMDGDGGHFEKLVLPLDCDSRQDERQALHGRPHRGFHLRAGGQYHHPGRAA